MTVAICYHPFPDRYKVCDQVEKCGWCGVVRYTSQRGNPWLPVVKRDGSVTPPARLGRVAQDNEPH